MTQDKKSNIILTFDFLKLSFALFTPEIRTIHENTITLFSFENECFTLSSSSFSSIYNITIAINTPTTMNNQFEALNAPKNQISTSFHISYAQKPTSLSLYLYIHPKNLRF